MEHQGAPMDWLAKQLAEPLAREEYRRELTKMHREALASRRPDLARWCMWERARVDRIR